MTGLVGLFSEAYNEEEFCALKIDVWPCAFESISVHAVIPDCCKGYLWNSTFYDLLCTYLFFQGVTENLQMISSPRENTSQSEEEIDDIELDLFVKQVLSKAKASLGSVTIEIQSITDSSLKEKVTNTCSSSLQSAKCNSFLSHSFPNRIVRVWNRLLGSFVEAGILGVGTVLRVG